MKNTQENSEASHVLLSEDAVPIPDLENKEVQPSLAGRAVKGVGWTFAGNSMVRVLGLVRIFVMARLLAPADFGVFGVVMITIGLINTFSSTGFSDTLIQKKGDISNYLDTAWTVEFLRGVTVAVLLFVVAPLVEKFYATPHLTSLLRVTCLMVVISGFNNIGIVYFSRNLDYRRQFIFNGTGNIVSILVGIVLAFVLRSAWALVWAELAGWTTRCILSYALHPYKPRLRLNVAQLHEIFVFSRWLMVGGILYFFATTADNALVGKLLGTAALGIYQMSYNLTNMVGAEIAATIAQVTFPIFSRLQDTEHRVADAFLRTLKVSLLAIAPLCFGLAAVAPIFVPVILGHKWITAIPIIQILCVYGLCRTFMGIAGTMFLSLGHPLYNTIITAVNVTMMLMLLVPLTLTKGLPGTCVAVTIPVLICQIISLKLLCKIMLLKPTDIWRNVQSPLIAGALMCSVLWLMVSVLSASLISLVAVAALGVATYLMTLLCIDRPLILESKALIGSLLKKS